MQGKSNIKAGQGLLVFIALLLLWLMHGPRCMAQTADTLTNATPAATAPVDTLTAATGDSLSDEDLEYRLTKHDFMVYYGNDDTSRALINMFFYKRSYFPYYQISSNPTTPGCCGTAAVLYFTGGIALIALGIRAGINCSIYTRQALLYALLDHEHGYGVPPQFARKLRSRFFDYDSRNQY